MKKLFLSAVFALCATFAFSQAKYVFLFIGDGMGFGAVSLTEAYLSAANDWHVGSGTLAFSKFSVTGFCTTYSSDDFVTCSAAAGTAFSCGEKTNNGRVGMNSYATESLTSIAARLKKEKGYKIGITTSVSIDHATPAVFYAHQPERGMYYEIACELPLSNFDFFSGAGFIYPKGKEGNQESVFDILAKNGYTVARSLADARASTAQKLVLLQPENKEQSAFPYVIDRAADDYTLAQTTDLAIDKLNSSKGFFLMVEGGKIDWASHDNDAGTMVREVIDFSDAVKLASIFYNKHPTQTLIVVTADHETGGLGITKSGGVDDLLGLQKQKSSVDKFVKRMNEGISYNDFIQWTVANFGVEWTADDKTILHKLFVDNVAGYSNNDNIPCQVNNIKHLSLHTMRMVSRKSGAGYNTGEHTGTMVPVYAIGVGSELFGGKIDNTDIPKVILNAFAEIKPRLIIAVPLIIEKIYRNNILPVISKPTVKALLALPVVDKQICHQILKKLNDTFGDNFIEIIIGGAGLNQEVERFFKKIGFAYTVGYGMTECAPIISYSDRRETSLYACGKAVINMEIRIDSDDPAHTVGEIQVRGKNVMLGYYKNEEATKNMFTPDGWLKTGDLGVIDKNGYLYIKGRSKNLILGASGQNIYPEEIEDKINNMPYVVESIVLDNQGKLVALVYPDFPKLQEDGKKSKEEMENMRVAVNLILPAFSQIAEVRVFPEEFEKTPKRSIKRFMYQV
ncbi:hypothetical protein FACS1894156_8450 [Bacteroidia bacterium]|nr:hypothetical protein FACS1894156_8450 [Bacteroidia bacterium]